MIDGLEPLGVPLLGPWAEHEQVFLLHWEPRTAALGGVHTRDWWWWPCGTSRDASGVCVEPGISGYQAGQRLMALTRRVRHPASVKA